MSYVIGVDCGTSGTKTVMLFFRRYHDVTKEEAQAQT